MIKRLLQRLFAFLTRRLMLILRIGIGIFMILIGGWFILAPITQQFLSVDTAVSDYPYLWLIVPVGIVQIIIGISLLKPLINREQTQ